MTKLIQWAGSPAAVRIIPFAVYILFLVVESVLADHQTQWDQRWLYAVKTGLVLAALLILFRHYGELLRPVSVSLNEWFIGLITGIVVFVLWINLDQPWATIGESKGYIPHKPGSQELDWLLVAVRISGAALVVPVMEELFWRSFLLRWIQKPDFLSVVPKSIGRNAFLITAVLFALEHNLWLAGLLAGIAYNWLYIRTGNLWIVIMAHAVTNGLLATWVLYSGQWKFW